VRGYPPLWPLCGSPPQAWGRHRCCCLDGIATRFTPTGVGTAGKSSDLIAAMLVHPHRRGDGWGAIQDNVTALGSPPQAWGRHACVDGGGGDARFTPTGVGTAARPARSGLDEPVHPHRRGDGANDDDQYDHCAGSPPQAWGRQTTPVSQRSPTRFTPTGVGTAMSSGASSAWDSVHPHRRGDGARPRPLLARFLGSPPQAWGRRAAQNKKLEEMRFTPTGVGTAPPCMCAPLSSPVHPHRRGDGGEPAAWPNPYGGSPPQAWGRLDPLPCLFSLYGSPPQAWGRHWR